MKFLYLGRSIRLIDPFDSDTKQASLLDMEPTLSPEDPNFQKWWEEHKSDWKRDGFPESWGIGRLEKRRLAKKNGQEPADD